MALNTGNTKPFKSFPELVQILIDRGLIVKDRSAAEKLLHEISYYRLSAYSLTLRKNDAFYPNVTLENIYELYDFDCLLRSLILKYCAIIEVSFRNYIAHYHAEHYGPLGYLDDSLFVDSARHQKFLTELEEEISRSDDVFIVHHRNKLNSVFPVWVAMEVSTFGVLSKFYKNMPTQDRASIARQYIGMPREYVENWLQCCSYCRNVAAHGGRFYNRLLRACPVKLDPKTCKGLSNVSPYAFLLAITKLLPSEQQKQQLVMELDSLFCSHPFVLKKHLRFPVNWKSYMI